MMTQILTDPTLSLFGRVTGPNRRHMFIGHRHTLLRISESIEDSVLVHHIPARVFAGFQRLSYFLPRAARFARIAQNAESVFVFGIPDVIPPEIPGIQYIYLNENHALANEWFVVSIADQYFNALIARDLSGFHVPQSDRQFEGMWLFETEPVIALQRWLSEAAGIPPLDLDCDACNLSNHLGHISNIATHLIAGLEQRNEELRQTERTRHELVSMIVHDLRNPISVLSGYVDLLEHMANSKYRPTPTDLVDFSHDMRRSLDDLAQLVEDILDIDRLEAGMFPVKHEPVSVAPLFEALRQRFQIITDRRGLALEVELEDRDIQIFGDRDLLRRILANLLSNAIRHTPHGSVTLHAHRNGDSLAHLAVKDTGEGIAADKFGKIFEPFQQGESTHKGVAGLGLTFCKHATEAQGGRIRVESQVGVGSTFYVSLPIAAATLV